ncbi:hypothetical protein GGP47_003047 [Salinibacter ruber]|nr:hypothetical protein [Salinibacter ruber]
MRIFANIDSAWRLIGTVLAERQEEWSTGRKYLEMAEFPNWNERAHRPEPEPDDSPEGEPVMVTYPTLTQRTFTQETPTCPLEQLYFNLGILRQVAAIPGRSY